MVQNAMQFKVNLVESLDEWRPALVLQPNRKSAAINVIPWMDSILGCLISGHSSFWWNFDKCFATTKKCKKNRLQPFARVSFAVSANYKIESNEKCISIEFKCHFPVGWLFNTTPRRIAEGSGQPSVIVLSLFGCSMSRSWGWILHNAKKPNQSPVLPSYDRL